MSWRVRHPGPATSPRPHSLTNGPLAGELASPPPGARQEPEAPAASPHQMPSKLTRLVRTPRTRAFSALNLDGPRDSRVPDLREDDENENAPTDRVCLAIEHARLTTQSDFFSRRTRGAQSPGHMSLGHQQATPESELQELRELIFNTQKKMFELCQRVQVLEASHTRLHSEWTYKKQVIPGLKDLIDKLEAQLTVALTAQSHRIDEVQQKILQLGNFQEILRLGDFAKAHHNILQWLVREQNTEAEGEQEYPQSQQGEQEAGRSPGPDEQEEQEGPQGQTRAGGPPPDTDFGEDARGLCGRRGRALGGPDVQLGGGFQPECGLQPDLETYHTTV